MDADSLYFPLVKRLGRNARPGERGVLDENEATALWQALLDQSFSPPQEAALLMGLRVHSESAAMLAAFARETLSRCARIAAARGPATVVLHCLGTARRQPILAPLLALRLAELDVPVLLITFDAQRGANTTAVLTALACVAARDHTDAARQLAHRRFAWITVDTLCPVLARVLARRVELGFRNTAHSLIKLLAPVDGRALVVANYTHPQYRESFAEAVGLMKLSAMLVRGTEGDPVAWEAATYRSEAWIEGRAIDLPAVDISAGESRAVAPLPDPLDVAATARFCERAIKGDAQIPAAIERQASVLAALARA